MPVEQRPMHGCCVEQVWNDQDERDETLAMVVRTGKHTALGSLLLTNPYKAGTLADRVIFKVKQLCR